MYYHAKIVLNKKEKKVDQSTYVVISKDGLNFNSRGNKVGSAYAIKSFEIYDWENLYGDRSNFRYW